MTSQSVPMIETSRVVALTPKGEATMLVYRALRAIRELDADERGHVLEMLRLELSELPA